MKKLIALFCLLISFIGFASANGRTDVCETRMEVVGIVDNNDKIAEMERQIQKIRDEIRILESEHGNNIYGDVEYCESECIFDYDDYIKEERHCVGQYTNPFNGSKHNICLPGRDVYEMMKQETNCNYGRMTSMLAICGQESGYQELYMNGAHKDGKSIGMCGVLYGSTDPRVNVRQAMDVLDGKKGRCEANGQYGYSTLQQCSYQGYNGHVHSGYRGYGEKIMWIFNHLVSL